MAARSWVPLVVAALVAAGCIRLGLWQLDRLAERKARNAAIEAAFRQAPIPVEHVRPDSSSRFRRVVAEGVWDYGRETAIIGRTRDGSPGVHIVTPMTVSGGMEVLINRGWVYSPDARTVDLSRWREGERGRLVAYVDRPPSFLPSGAGALYVVALQDSGKRPERPRPVRLAAPAFDERGPHLGYAVQWFSFAAIAVIGAPILVRRQGRGRG